MLWSPVNVPLSNSSGEGWALHPAHCPCKCCSTVHSCTYNAQLYNSILALQYVPVHQVSMIVTTGMNVAGVHIGAQSVQNFLGFGSHSCFQTLYYYSILLCCALFQNLHYSYYAISLFLDYCAVYVSANRVCYVVHM